MKKLYKIYAILTNIDHSYEVPVLKMIFRLVLSPDENNQEEVKITDRLRAAYLRKNENRAPLWREYWNRGKGALLT